MIQSIGKLGLTFKSAVPPVAPVAPQMPPTVPPVDKVLAESKPADIAATNPLERSPQTDEFTPVNTIATSPFTPREMYDNKIHETQAVLTQQDAAAQGLTTAPAIEQAAEKGDNRAKQKLSIAA